MTRLLLLPLLAACTFDTGESQYCDRVVDITGAVDGVDVAFDDYEVQSVWFNTSLEQELDKELSSIDREIMEEMGLDPDNNEDVARYRYFNQAYDLRFLFIEQLSESDYGALGAEIGRDLGVFFFDLEPGNVQPDTDVAVFDLSPVEAPRDAGNKQALGNALRTALDTMRDNGKPDVLVAFAPDRSDEGQPRSTFINLFGESTRFASAGTARFGNGMTSAGEPLDAIEYPLTDVDNLGLSASVTIPGATLAGETVTIDADCVVVSVSGE